MHHEPLVCIIILNYKKWQDTIECLAALRKIEYSNFHIILIENGSDNESLEKLREYCQDTNIIYLINSQNQGFAKGNNGGIRYSLDHFGPDYYLLLNNDTVVDPLFLGKLVEAAEKNPHAGFLGPKEYYYGNPSIIHSAGATISLWRGRTYHRGEGEVDHHQYDKQTEVEFITGACVLVPKRVIESIGLLDESYFFFGEDVDWCFQGKKKGFISLYVPDAVIWHKVGASTPTALHKYYLTKYRFLFLKKNTSPTIFSLFLLYFICIIMPGNIIIGLLRGDIPFLKSFIKGTYEGLLLKVDS